MLISNKPYAGRSQPINAQVLTMLNGTCIQFLKIDIHSIICFSLQVLIVI